MRSDGSRHALLIGNNAYREGPLRNPINDVRLMAATLEALDFDVLSATDVTKRALAESVRAFQARIRPGGVAFAFFSGHGIQHHGESYLIPVDAAIEFASEIEYEAYHAQRLADAIAASGAGLSIVVLDACRDVPFRFARSLATRGLAPLATRSFDVDASEPQDYLIVYATQPGDVALDGVGTMNSPFTDAFARSLQVPDLTLDEVMQRTVADVQAVTRVHGRAQRPVAQISLTRRHVLNTRHAPLTAAGSSPPPPPRPEPEAPAAQVTPVAPAVPPLPAAPSGPASSDASRPRPGVAATPHSPVATHNLRNAVRRANNAQRVRAHIAGGADVNARDEDQRTPLMDAVDPEVAWLLLSSGADVDARDEAGQTALIHAVSRGEREHADIVVRVLLEGGADVNARCRRGMPVLSHAVFSGGASCSVVRALVEAGAEIDASDDDGETALLHAARFQRPAVVRELLSFGADVGARDANGATALMVAAATNSHAETLRVLAEGGVDIDARDADGYTALMIAAEGVASPDAVRVLLAAGADADVETESGVTALSIAEDNDEHPDVIELLRGAGASRLGAASAGHRARAAEQGQASRRSAPPLQPGQVRELATRLAREGFVALGPGTFELTEPLELAPDRVGSVRTTHASLEIVGAGRDRTRVRVADGACAIRWTAATEHASLRLHHLAVEYGGSGGDVVVVQGGEVSIEHVALRGGVAPDDDDAGDGEYTGAALLALGTTRGVARELELEGSGSGFVAQDEVSLHLVDSHVHGNDAGIGVFDDATCLVRGCTIESNEGCGIEVGDRAHPRLEQNSVRGNAAGMLLEDEARGSIQRNTIERHRDGGIVVQGRAAPILAQNVIRASGVGLAYMDDTRGWVWKNVIERNQRGAELADRAQPTFEQNVFRRNEEAGIAYFGEAAGLLTRNEFVGGEEASAFISSEESSPSLEGNTWREG